MTSSNKYPSRFQLYPDAPQQKREVFTRTYEYELPFKYPNVEVERTCGGGEPHGMEMFTVPPGDEDTFVYGPASPRAPRPLGTIPRWARPRALRTRGACMRSL